MGDYTQMVSKRQDFDDIILRRERIETFRQWLACQLKLFNVPNAVVLLFLVVLVSQTQNKLHDTQEQLASVQGQILVSERFISTYVNNTANLGFQIAQAQATVNQIFATLTSTGLNVTLVNSIPNILAQLVSLNASLTQSLLNMTSRTEVLTNALVRNVTATWDSFSLWFVSLNQTLTSQYQGMTQSASSAVKEVFNNANASLDYSRQAALDSIQDFTARAENYTISLLTNATSVMQALNNSVTIRFITIAQQTENKAQLLFAEANSQMLTLTAFTNRSEVFTETLLLNASWAMQTLNNSVTERFLRLAEQSETDARILFDNATSVLNTTQQWVDSQQLKFFGLYAVPTTTTASAQNVQVPVPWARLSGLDTPSAQFSSLSPTKWNLFGGTFGRRFRLTAHIIARPTSLTTFQLYGVWNLDGKACGAPLDILPLSSSWTWVSTAECVASVQPSSMTTATFVVWNANAATYAVSVTAQVSSATVIEL